jgi:hypothetical protein
MRLPFGVRRTVEPATVALLALAGANLLLHLTTNALGGYGYFRDELYYLACSRNLAAGYVDHPPFSVFVLALNTMLFGDSLFALRLLPALAGAATVVVTGFIARRLGGGMAAQMLAALGAFASLYFLGTDGIYSMNCFDILFWACAAYATMALVDDPTPRRWLVLGLIIGVGAMNKIGVLWYGGGIALGVLFSPLRTWLRTRWPYAAALLAFLLFLPYVLWNAAHDFAHLEFIRNATSGKYSGLGVQAFLIGQFLMQNPVTLILWASGLVFLFTPAGSRGRPLAVAFLATAAILLINRHSKAEYLSPAYCALFAAGGVALERWLASGVRWVFLPLYGAIIGAGGLLLAPAVLPILPVDTYIRYAETLRIAPSTAEAKQLDKLPQFYADMFGWEEKVRAVAGVYSRLSPSERQRCALFADNYGRCGAIDLFGPRYGLPRSIGRHNNYWIWGPRGYTGEIVIILGGDLADKERNFEQVEVAATVSSPHCMPYENNLRVYLCRGLKTPLASAWPTLKHFD